MCINFDRKTCTNFSRYLIYPSSPRSLLSEFQRASPVSRNFSPFNIVAAEINFSTRVRNGREACAANAAAEVLTSGCKLGSGEKQGYMELRASGGSHTSRGAVSEIGTAYPANRTRFRRVEIECLLHGDEKRERKRGRRRGRRRERQREKPAGNGFGYPRRDFRRVMIHGQKETRKNFWPR